MKIVMFLLLSGCSAFIPREPDGTVFRTIGYNSCPEGNARTVTGLCEATGYAPTMHYSIVNSEELSREN